MDLAKELETYYNMAYAEHIHETRLVNLLILIKEKCEKILRFASQYDYDPNHAFNGYRSTVLFVVKFLEAVHCTKLNRDFDGTVDEVILICNALNKTLTSVLQFHENSVKYHRTIEDRNDEQTDEIKEQCKQQDEIFKLQMPIDRQSLVDAFEAMQDNDIPFIFNKYYEFFYKVTNFNSINQTMLSNFLENFDLWSWFKTLTSSTLTDTSLFLNATQLGLSESTFGSSQLNVVKNWLPFLSSTKPYIVETITIKRQLEWLICPITFELKHNPHKFQVLNNRKKFIKCRLLRNTVNSSGHLLIYLFSPDYFNKENEIANSFLSDWSLKLSCCSILIPELVYDKNEKFITPLQLQDVLDCYLWVIGKNNCVNKIELLNMPKQFSTNNSNENLSLKRTTHRSHSRSSSISSYFNNSLSANKNISTNSNSTAQYSNPFKNSEQVLDGIPDYITLSGDSSGGNLATALLLVLNDLKTKFKCNDLKLPNALVTAFTPFNLRDYSPIMQLTSRFSYSLSPIIALTACESNLPLPEIEDDDDLITLNESKKEKLNDTINEKLDDLLLSKQTNNGRPIVEDKLMSEKMSLEQQHQNEVIKEERHTKRTNTMNKYLIDRLNECKLSDFFQQFSYLNNGEEEDDDDVSDDQTDLKKQTTLEGVHSDDDAAYNSSNDELNLNLSYFAKTLMSYLSQYYTTHISTQMNHLSDFEEDDESRKLKKNKLETAGTVSNKNKKDQTIKRKVSKNLRSDLENMKFDNQENDSLIQNAFTMFRLFFNGSEKKPNETLQWNKEIVGKIFTEQREKAFLDLTKRPYISPAFYDDFESLENVSLYLLNSTCDMFLDDNICMAKKWKGKRSCIDSVLDI